MTNISGLICIKFKGGKTLHVLEMQRTWGVQENLKSCKKFKESVTFWLSTKIIDF